MRTNPSMGSWHSVRAGLLAKVTRDDLIHHRIPEGLFVVKVVVQRASGDAGCGQNGVQVSAPKARAAHLLEGSLQQEFSCALRISRGRPPGSRSFSNS